MPKFPDDLNTHQRLKLAKELTAKLIIHIPTLFLMHEANAIILYSPTLADQIPLSYAAHAFNQFQRSMYLFELVRLCALWDKPCKDRESIPTIVALLNKQEIIAQVVQDTRDFVLNRPQPANFCPRNDTEIQAVEKASWQDYKSTWAEEKATKSHNWLLKSLTKTHELSQGSLLSALRKFRDAFIAHNLDLPETPSNEPTTVHRLLLGDEAKLLTETVAIADALHLGLMGSYFDWKESQENACDEARALWEGCQFRVKR